MSTKVTVAGITSLRVEDPRQRLEPGVGDGDDAGVWLDRGKGVVRGEHPGVGECVEEGGLADVGQTDDSYGKGHRPAG